MQGSQYRFPVRDVDAKGVPTPAVCRVFLVCEMNRALIQRAKRILFFLGIALLIGTAIVAIAVVGGFIQFPENLIAGESTVHSIARFAIVGCLFAALGSME